MTFQIAKQNPSWPYKEVKSWDASSLSSCPHIIREWMVITDWMDLSMWDHHHLCMEKEAAYKIFSLYSPDSGHDDTCSNTCTHPTTIVLNHRISCMTR